MQKFKLLSSSEKLQILTCIYTLVYEPYVEYKTHLSKSSCSTNHEQIIRYHWILLPQLWLAWSSCEIYNSFSILRWIFLVIQCHWSIFLTDFSSLELSLTRCYNIWVRESFTQRKWLILLERRDFKN